MTKGNAIPRQELITVGAPFKVEKWNNEAFPLPGIPDGSTVEVVPRTEAGTYFSRVEFNTNDMSHTFFLDTANNAFSPYARREAVAKMVEGSDKQAADALKNFPEPDFIPKPGFPTEARYNGQNMGLASKDAWLYGATCHGDAKAVHHFLVNEHANPFRPTETGETSAEKAFQSRTTEVFDDRFRYQGGLLGASISQRHDGMLDRLAKIGGFRDVQPQHLEIAVSNGTPHSVFLCLKNGVDADDKRFKAPILNTLFDNGKLEAENQEKAQYLLRSGADPRAKDEQGNTPLHKACLHGNRAIEDLLAYGADANARNKEMQTPLHLALGNKVDAVNVQTLLEMGADPNARDAHGKTPLHSVASNPDASPKLIDLLVNAGARVDSPDLDGNTPLHLSAKNATDLHASRLINHGADVFAKNNRGEIADITPANVKREAIAQVRELDRPAFNPFEARRNASAGMSY